MRAVTKQKSDHLALQQRLILHYSRIADWLETRPWYRDDKVVTTVRSLISGNPSRVLELCCGSGLLMEALSQVLPTASFVGVDISPVMAQRARERLSGRKNVRVLNQDWMYGLESQLDHKFDVIIVKNALHVLDEVVTKLKDLRLISHAWTTLIVVETISPNADANDFIRRLFRIVDSQHLKRTFFTERTLAATLEEAGWLMIQDRPVHLTQHIDTRDWLEQRCGDRLALSSAERLLTETRNLRVRHSLDFDAGPGGMPSRMLRLQFVARHVFLPAVDLSTETHAANLTQLQLLS